MTKKRSQENIKHILKSVIENVSRMSSRNALEMSMKKFWGTNLVASLVSKSNQFLKKYDNFHKLTLPYL